MNTESSNRLALAHTYRLQWEESQQKYVILYPEGMVVLHGSAAEILKLCDGTRNLEAIVAELEQKFETKGLHKDVENFTQSALENGWIRTIS